jgi:hypothetical protein
MSFGEVFNFSRVFQSEVNTLNKRRSADHQIALEQESEDTHGEEVKRPTATSDIIGLALSGGGIRSASFCLGALQALHRVGVLHKIDYLSTVSGGGYIGSSLIAAMHESEGEFPFESKLEADESTSVQHIRDHSNYLFAGGIGDVLDAVAIYIRGLVVNAVLILPWLLLAAALTIYLHPSEASLLSAYAVGANVSNPRGYFAVTAYLCLIAIALFLVWGMWPAFRTILRGGYSAIPTTVKRADNQIRTASTNSVDTRPSPTRPIEVPRPSMLRSYRPRCADRATQAAMQGGHCYRCRGGPRDGVSLDCLTGATALRTSTLMNVLVGTWLYPHMFTGHPLDRATTSACHSLKHSRVATG